MELEQDRAQEPDISQKTALLGLLAPPVIWAAYHAINYAVVSLSCTHGWLQGNLLGFAALRIVVIVITLIATGAIVFSGYRAFSNWHALRDHDDDQNLYPEEKRSLFMSYAGLVMAVLFGAATLATGIPAAFLQVCPEVF